MVTGKADDAYDSVSYVMSGSPQNNGFASAEAFEKYINVYGYKKDSLQNATVLITDDLNAQDVAISRAANSNLKVYTYRSIQPKLTKKSRWNY